VHVLLETLLDQHRDLARLIGLLDRLPSLEPDPAAAHAGLLVDVLVYLTNFPDVSHHPLEDRIALRLVERGALSHALNQELEAQHARLAQQGPALLRDMEGAMRRESASLELVALNSRLYAERLRHNIAFEELALFPAAARGLGGDDWAWVAAGYEARPDPLFSSALDQRFAQLRRAISHEADDGATPGTPAHLEALVDEAEAESFPASDPPAVTPRREPVRLRKP
jgi:hemerythrin-like domain-containing protein